MPVGGTRRINIFHVIYAKLNPCVPTVCAEGVLQSLLNMHEVFQQLKMSNCFDWKKKDVTEKSGERLKKKIAQPFKLQQLCSTADLCTLQNVCHCFCYDVRGGAGFSPSVAPVTAPVMLQLGAKASSVCCISLFLKLMFISSPEVAAAGRRWETLTIIYKIYPVPVL